jgi:hypothetical protein
MSGVFPSHKSDVSDNACKHFHFPAVGKSICRNRTAINQSETEGVVE